MSGPDRGQPGFEEFVAARRQALLRTAYLLTGSHEDAEDLVQVALVKAVPHWSRIADHPEPYVRRILARESVSRWRRRRWRELSTDDLPERPQSSRTRPIGWRCARRWRRLAPRQRAVIVLRYFDDLTERQTAEALGIGVGTVKSQTRDALARLRGLLPDLDEEPSTAHPVSRSLPAGYGWPMIVAFSISPSAGDETGGVSEAVAAAVRVVRESGLPNETNAMFTNIEGEWDEVMAVVKRAVDVVAAVSPRVGLVLKADIRPGYDGQLTAKVERVERALEG